MVAEYTCTNSAKSDPCQQFSPERRQARKAKSGRVVRKVCQHKRPQEERSMTTATASKNIDPITYADYERIRPNGTTGPTWGKPRRGYPPRRP